MTTGFFVLAFVAALNPKFLAVDLLLIKNRRPRAMFVCILAGGMTVALAIGLLDVLVLHADAIDSQKTESASADLVLGLLLLVAGALVATGHLHGRRKAPVPAGNRPPQQPEKKDGWAERALAEPRLGLAMLIGALAGIPGFAYLSALNKLVTGEYSTAAQVAAVIVFVLIEFALIIIPFAFLVFRPEATRALLKHAQDWLTGHSRQLIADTAMILGAFMAISGLVQLT